MKIVYNTWFPFGNYHTLNFFGILFTKRKQLPESTITHESIQFKADKYKQRKRIYQFV